MTSTADNAGLKIDYSVVDLESIDPFPHHGNAEPSVKGEAQDE